MTSPDPERDRAIVEGVVDALWMPACAVGLDDMMLAWNAAAAARFGSAAGLAERARFKELPLSYRVAGLRAAVERVKAGGDPETIGSGEPLGGGLEAGLRFSVRPLRVGADLIGVLVTADDHSEVATLKAQLALVTDDLQATTEQMEQTTEELRVANEELREANNELEARLRDLQTAQDAVRHKDDFLAMLAHELRNPLAPILSSTHVLRAQPDNAAGVQRAREVIERQVRHQARLLDDLLDVSRVSRGRIQLRRRPVDLRAIVAEVIETTRPLIDERHLELSSPAAPQALPLQADPDRLAQVVANLVTNAVKYTPPGGRITVTAERELQDAVLRVRDSGVGIPTDMLERIFELFTQVDPTLARSQGGLGIGLTLVKSLVEMHRGTVEARSAGLGQGSELTVRLPLAGAVPEHAATAVAASAGPRHILIVEDNADAREMLHAVLALEGHRVLASEDGVGGIEMAVLHRPEIVLVDIGLPGMSGYEVARRIREALGQRVTLVALTGYGQPGDRRHAREAGFDAHLVKPVGLDNLQTFLRADRQDSA